jgi:hypothetical protein
VGGAYDAGQGMTRAAPASYRWARINAGDGGLHMKTTRENLCLTTSDDSPAGGYRHLYPAVSTQARRPGEYCPARFPLAD